MDHLILIKIHSILRWFIVIISLYIFLVSIFKYNSKNTSVLDRKMYVFNMIFFHIQVTLGIVLFFISSKVNFVNLDITNKIFRFFTIEHTIGIILSLILVTLEKKKTDIIKQPYKTLLFYYSFIFLILLASIPWPFRMLGTAWW